MDCINLGQLVRCIKKDNSDINCFCFTKKSRENAPASLYYRSRPDPILSVPKGQVPRHTIKDQTGIIKRGWEDIVKILAGKRYINGKRVLKYIKSIKV